MTELTRVVVAGTGPSFGDEQAAYLQQAHANQRCFIIAINDNYIKLPFADMLYSADKPWWDLHHPQISLSQFGGELWTCNDVTAREYGIRHVLATNKPGLCTDADKIHTGGNSGYQGVGLAYHRLAKLQGRRQILLVGFDFQKTDKKAHWFGDHPKPLSRTHPYKVWLAHFPQLVVDLRKHGIEIINCTTQTALTCLPRGKLEEYL